MGDEPLKPCSAKVKQARKTAFLAGRKAQSDKKERWEMPAGYAVTHSLAEAWTAGWDDSLKESLQRKRAPLVTTPQPFVRHAEPQIETRD